MLNRLRRSAGQVVDTVGNKILAKALAQMQYGGAAAICGLAGGLRTKTVMPFILQGVSLLRNRLCFLSI